MRRLLCLAAVAACAATITGCGTFDSELDTGMPSAYGTPGSSGMGATQGGVQDMSFARELVEQGRVPPADALVVEAMFSEHDLPLEGAGCSTVLCLRAAMGAAPSADGSPAAWVQVGMSSTIDPESFERPSQAIVATVDVSGSMGWTYPNETTAGSISRELLYAIAGELDDQDRFTMVTYGSTVTRATNWLPGGHPSIDAAIAELDEGGSTNMEGGLELAYQVAAQALGETDEVRILLFTDVQPNVGATSASAFESMAAAGADEGIGLTVFGVGLGMGADLFKAMSQLHGGNAFSLMATGDVAPFMEDNWPWFVSPIAYDLSVQAEPSPNLELTQAYGFPKNDDAPSAALDVATVFLSKRRGALLLELAPLGDADLEGAQVDLSLSYVDQHGEPFSESLTATYPEEARLDDRGTSMPQPGIAKAVALALLVSAMHDAAELYGADQTAAVERLTPAIERFAADAEALADEQLLAEAEFWPQLLELMEQGATQGSLYDR